MCVCVTVQTPDAISSLVEKEGADVVCLQVTRTRAYTRTARTAPQHAQPESSGAQAVTAVWLCVYVAPQEHKLQEENIEGVTELLGLKASRGPGLTWKGFHATCLLQGCTSWSVRARRLEDRSAGTVERSIAGPAGPQPDALLHRCTDAQKSTSARVLPLCRAGTTPGRCPPPRRATRVRL
jgi:hypothetical protein